MKRLPAMHPNGFWIYIIKIFKSKSRLRFHYWPRGVNRLDTPHDHRTWFISIPLWGRFLEKKFVKTEGSDYEVLKCRTASRKSLMITIHEGYSNLVQVKQRRRYPLIPYFCTTDEIHSYRPINKGWAASLVFFGPPKVTPKLWRKI